MAKIILGRIYGSTQELVVRLWLWLWLLSGLGMGSGSGFGLGLGPERELAREEGAGGDPGDGGRGVEDDRE